MKNGWTERIEELEKENAELKNKLTKEQEDQIHDLPHHDKKVEKSFTITNTKWIDPNLFDQIVKGIGCRKFGKTTKKVKGGLYPDD